MRQFLQTTLQITLLVFFASLIARGKIQLWMVVFLAGVLASFLFSRLYCGYICPINTVMKGATALKKRLKIKDRPIPVWIRNPWIRTVFLLAFVALAILSKKLGVEWPILPALFVLGIVLTLFYPEQLWHRYLCPYGAILRFPAKTSRFGMKIDEAACINCGACARVCPTATIHRPVNSNGSKGTHQITRSECLVCHTCESVCKTEAIRYQPVKPVK